jgi:hypothetical protein
MSAVAAKAPDTKPINDLFSIGGNKFSRSRGFELLYLKENLSSAVALLNTYK